MKYVFIHKRIPVADIEIDEATGSIQKIGKVYAPEHLPLGITFKGGVVAKLYRPEIDLTLMEPTGKRVEFLRRLCERLDITADVVKERAEEAARKQWRETFDVATARAVAALPALAEYCLPLVKVGGWFITMKGANAEEEMESAAGAVKKLGAVFEKELSFGLPDNSLRSLIFYRKVSPTPPAYPRNGGKIAKAPLR